MNVESNTEYVELCEQLAAVELLGGETAAAPRYGRLDRLWNSLMTDEERREAEDRLVVKARVWHEARRTEDP